MFLKIWLVLKRFELDTIEDLIDIFNSFVKDFFTAFNERKFPVHSFLWFAVEEELQIEVYVQHYI